jgi:16S rRNA (cytosine967-C5)-methyltransferase
MASDRPADLAPPSPPPPVAEAPPPPPSAPAAAANPRVNDRGNGRPNDYRPQRYERPARDRGRDFRPGGRPPQDFRRRDDNRGNTGAGDAGGGQANAVNRSRPLYEDLRAQRRNNRGPNRGRNGRPDFNRGGNPRYGGGRPFDSRRAPEPPQRQRIEEPAGMQPLPSNPREAALRILQAVDTRSAFSDRLLDGAHLRGGPDARDHALLHELVKGTLRWRGRIDWVLDRLVHIGIDKVQPWIRNVLRLGAYQILFLDRIPAHAAVDEAVKLGHQYGHPGTAGLANSVLRRLVEEKDTLIPPDGDDAQSLSIWGSHPLWIVERWLARFGPDATRALMSANNKPIPIGLRVNRLKLTRDELIERLTREGVTAVAATHSPDIVWATNAAAPGALESFKRGLCTAQDESEALVSRLVAPVTHERLLDLCAAPGGKCTHLAELMDDEGEVWAMERADGRVDALETTVKRLGLHAIHVVQGDGRSYNFPMPFDRVLVDAPCSGLGVLGRRADARWRKGPEVLREMPGIQLDLLSAGARRVRPGGVVVYSVCSFEPEETTDLVERFLRTNPSFMIETAAGVLPDEVVDENGFMSVLPHVHGCDGAFAARFRRT